MTPRTARIHEAAEQELRAAAQWYEDQRQDLGKRFLVEVDRVLALLCRTPSLGAPVPQVRGELAVHRFPLRRFPYFVIYRIHNRELQIIAFAHTTRTPRYWGHRS